MKQKVMVELAGRDSVVSLLKFLEDNKGTEYTFIFSVVCVPSEDETNTFILDLGEILKEYVENLGHTVEGLHYSCDIRESWFYLIKDVQKSVDKYGFWSPCIACHALCHLYRVILCKKLGYGTIITGERTSHGEVYKMNQDKAILDRYDQYFESDGVEFIRPLEQLDTEAINDIYDKFCDEIEIDRGSKDSFAKCYMSGCWKFSEGCSSVLVKYFDEELVEKLNVIKESDIAVNEGGE